MSEIVNNCPLCSGENSRHFDRRTFRGQVVVNRVCKSCGLVFQSPRMTEEETNAFYQAEYRRMYQGKEGPIARDFSTQTARAGSLLGFIQPIIPTIPSHLDIGCSTGLILQNFKKQFGCRPVGIEPGEAYRAYARQHGLAVYASLEELGENVKDRFTLISMSHVLEHLPDPVGYLVHLREALLDPQGWLLLEVPNLYAHDSFETAHLVSYSAHTLAQVVEKAGYELIKMERHGRPRSSMLPLYITLLARPEQKTPQGFVVRPEKYVFLKRRAGMLRRRIVEKLFPERAWLKE
jgi:2-polyprenyl-3-methyl-5-hydroxy-6-metoxy-1,4-benzoquinol methylase